MIHFFREQLIGGCVLVLVLLLMSTIYAYFVNARLKPGDPDKRDYSPHAIWMAPIILPLLVIGNIVVLLFCSLLFGAFLLLFPLSLLIFRRPFLIKWILEQALRIGNKMLEINTGLLRAAGLYTPAN